MKKELIKLLEENAGKENYDANRLEQELIYYIEKIDIREEQVRLKNHCEYFISFLKVMKMQKAKNFLLLFRKLGAKLIQPVQKLTIRIFKEALF